MRSDTARRASADIVRVLVDARRSARRICRRLAGSFNSGKARSIATISARSRLRVTSAPIRASSRSRSRSSRVVLAIRTSLSAAPLYQNALAGFNVTISVGAPPTAVPDSLILDDPPSRCRRSPHDEAFQVACPSIQLPSASLRRGRRVFASTSVGSHAVAERTAADRHGTPSARARHSAACHARATGPPLRHADPPSHPPLDAFVGFLNARRTHHITVPRRIRKWRTLARPPRT